MRIEESSEREVGDVQIAHKTRTVAAATAVAHKLVA